MANDVGAQKIVEYVTGHITVEAFLGWAVDACEDPSLDEDTRGMATVLAKVAKDVAREYIAPVTTFGTELAQKWNTGVSEG